MEEVESIIRSILLVQHLTSVRPFRHYPPSMQRNRCTKRSVLSHASPTPTSNTAADDDEEDKEEEANTIKSALQQKQNLLIEQLRKFEERKHAILTFLG